MGRKGVRHKRGLNLTSDQIKIRILVALFGRADGLNQNQISGLPSINIVEWNFLGATLAELCVVGKLNADPPDEYKEGSWIYTITDDGKNFIEKINELRGLGFGEGFALFE